MTRREVRHPHDPELRGVIDAEETTDTGERGVWVRWETRGREPLTERERQTLGAFWLVGELR